MLKDKAIENVAAGDLLLDRGHVNAAASRYYYAMYQAAVHALTRSGRAPRRIRSGALEWDHSMVENNAGLVRRRVEDRWLYGEVRQMRVLADYKASEVPPHELRKRRNEIAEFVEEAVR